MSLSDTLGLPPADGEFVVDRNSTLQQLLLMMSAKQMSHIVIPLDPPHASDAIHITITVSRPSQSRAITHAIVGILGKK